MHIKRIHQERPTCKECGKSYPNKSQINAHVKMVHLGIKLNECETCGKSFSLPKLLRTHIENVHLKLKPWACEVCGFKTAKHGNLNLHRAKSHNLPTLPAKEYKQLVATNKHPFCDPKDVDFSKLSA